MAYMTAVDSSSLSNQNIATPLLTHTYTNTTRVRKLFASIEADQVFGTGEYVVYATIQRGGAGAVFRAGSEAVIVSGGTTSLMFQALPVVLNVGDVLKTYIVGRGSDTTTPDITTRIWEESAADSGLDAAGVAAAVWDAALSSYNDAGSTGEALAGAGGGGGGLDAAGVRAAIGLASANLDTQLADLPTNSELAARTLAAADYFDPATDTVKLASATHTGAVIPTVTTVTNDVGISQTGADKVWSSTTRTLSAFGFSVTVGTNNDKAGYSLSSAGVQAIWDAAVSALTTVGSIGKQLVDRIDAAITSRMATFSYTAPLDAAGTRAAIGLAAANLDAQLADLPTNSELSAAIAAGDDATLGAIAALNNLSAAEAQTAAGAALTAYDAATGADVSGISVPTATQIADAVLSRGVVNIEDTADAGSLAELLLGAFESAVSGTTWTIRKTSGGTFSTRTVATDPNADPIVSVT